MNTVAVVVWLVMLVAFVATEFATVGLTAIWFAAGTIPALALAVAGAPVLGQGIAFFVVSFVLLIATRPWAKKYINSRVQKTNVDVLEGQEICIHEQVDNRAGTGRGVVRGQEWTVRAEKDDMVIAPGEEARILRIEGVKLIVTKKK